MQTSRQTSRGLALFAALGACAAALAQPVVFVVQERLPMEGEVDPNVLLGPTVADELAAGRRVRTVLWSVGDPEFVRWIQPEAVKVDATQPALKQALSLAKQNGAEYVLWLRASRTPNGVRPAAALYRGGRKVWSFEPKPADTRLPTGIRVSREERDRWQRDAEAILASAGMLVVVVDGQPDWEATAASVARTWRAQLESGPFSALPTAPVPTVAGEIASRPVPTPEDAEALLAEADRCRAASDLVGEAALLRRAVDIVPADAASRLRLAQALLALGLPAEAELAAVAGAALAADPTGHWMAAADARLALGNLDGSRDALRNALQTGAGPGLTGPIIDLLEGNAPAALQALKAQTGPRAAAWRACASAMLGRVEDVEAELGLLEAGERGLDERDYALFVIVLERTLQPLPDELRLLPASIRGAERGAMRGRASEAANRAECLALLVRGLDAPERHRRSHEGRRLAHALLLQSARETLAFAETGEEDSRLEAALSLAEAVRNLDAVRELHAAERASIGSPAKVKDGLDRGDGGSGGSGGSGLLGGLDDPAEAAQALAP